MAPTRAVEPLAESPGGRSSIFAPPWARRRLRPVLERAGVGAAEADRVASLIGEVMPGATSPAR